MSSVIEMTRGEMAVMDGSGDTKHMWSRDNADEVENARKTFRNFKEKGFACFKVDKRGEKSEQVDVFDPNAEKYIFVPPMAGG